MADGWGNKMLPFLAVGRVKDATTLACYINTDADAEDKTMDVFKKLLAAAASKLSAGQRTRLQWNDGSVCCLMDSKGENLYCVVTSLLTYPERLAYQLLYDLVAQASQEPDLATAAENGLNQTLQPKMKDMVLYYEDAKNFPQFALGMSRESLGSAPSSGNLEPAGANRSNMKLIVGVVALVLLLIIGYVVYSMGGETPTDAPTEAPGTMEAPTAMAAVADAVGKTARKAIMMV